MVDQNRYQYLQITGCYKSGTSLLFSLLDGHRDLSNFPTETSHTGYLFERLTSENLSIEKKIDLFKSRYYRHEHLLGKLLLNDILRSFDQYINGKDYDFWRYHLSFLDAYCNRVLPDAHQSSKYYMDKSPLSYLNADQIFGYCQNTKFIHILREPKNNFSSIMVKFLRNNRFLMDKLRLCWRYRAWLTQSLNWAKRNQNKFGKDRYLIIKFEELVTQTESTMKNICQFLNIQFNYDILTPTIFGNKFSGNNHEGLKFDSVSSINIDRWKERMPSWYGTAIEGFYNENWAFFGYSNKFNYLSRKCACFFLSTIILLADLRLKRYYFHGKQSKKFFDILAND